MEFIKRKKEILETKCLKYSFEDSKKFKLIHLNRIYDLKFVTNDLMEYGKCKKDGCKVSTLHKYKNWTGVINHIFSCWKYDCFLRAGNRKVLKKDEKTAFDETNEIDYKIVDEDISLPKYNTDILQQAVDTMDFSNDITDINDNDITDINDNDITDINDNDITDINDNNECGVIYYILDEETEIHLAQQEPGFVRTIDGINIMIKDLEPLLGKEWLNDIIVDSYLSLLARINKKAFVFSSFFYQPETRKTGINFFKRISKINLFTYHFIFFPICLDNHWQIAVYKNSEKYLLLLNPLESSRKNEKYNCILDNIISFLETYYLNTHNEPLLSEIKGLIVSEIPTQPPTNTYDCGVYILKYAQIICNYRSLAPDTFQQESIDNFRMDIYNSLYKGSIDQ